MLTAPARRVLAGRDCAGADARRSARSAGASVLSDAHRCAEVQQVGLASVVPGRRVRPASGAARRRGRGAAGRRPGGRRARPGAARARRTSARPRSAPGAPAGRRRPAGPRRPRRAAPRPDGWDRATASHNTVIVDGLNQRETLDHGARPPAAAISSSSPPIPTSRSPRSTTPGAYPRSTTRYRQTRRGRLGREGPLRGERLRGRTAGSSTTSSSTPAPGDRRLAVSVPMSPVPISLLPPSIPYLANAHAEDGRWFVQAYGEFDRMAHGLATTPATGDAWRAPTGPGPAPPAAATCPLYGREPGTDSSDLSA